MQIFAPAAAAVGHYTPFAQVQALELVGVYLLAGHAAAAAAAVVVAEDDDDLQNADACSAYGREMFAKALRQLLA